MSRLILIASAAFMYLGLAVTPTTVMAADDPNILIMAEDADADGAAFPHAFSTQWSRNSTNGAIAFMTKRP